MLKVPDFLENQKRNIYDEREFLTFLSFAKDFGYISEEKYEQVLSKSQTSEFKMMLEILVKYEIATWLEWPFVFILASYFAGDDVLESSKSIFTFLESGKFESIFQLFRDLDIGISKENVGYYFASIVPIVMGIRYATLKIITQNKDLPGKDTFCLLGAHPFPTTLTWIGTFTYFLSGYKDFYKLYGAFLKTRKEVLDVIEYQKSEKSEEFDVALGELKSKLEKIIS